MRLTKGIAVQPSNYVLGADADGADKAKNLAFLLALGAGAIWWGLRATRPRKNGDPHRNRLNRIKRHMVAEGYLDGEITRKLRREGADQAYIDKFLGK